MAGKNVLWVAKQHGHTITTMLRAYAAWTEGAVETDVHAIERSMKLKPHEVPLARVIAPCRYGRSTGFKFRTPCTLDNLAVDLPVANGAN